MLWFLSSAASSYYYSHFSGLLRFSHFLLFTTDVCYAIGSLLLLYIPQSELFAVVPLCPITNPTAPNKAREQPECISATIVNKQVQTIFHTTMLTATRFDLERNAFRVISKFQGHKLTFIPLL